MSSHLENASAVVVGTSWGGVEALSIILRKLPADFPLPVIIVQHQHPNSDDILSLILRKRALLFVKEAEEKELLMPGTVYIAPANYHLLIELDKTLSFSNEAPYNYSRPSIDLMFKSAVDVYGSGLIGIVLTGANDDGAMGLKMIKEFGGMTLVQEPSTATMDSMPLAAIEASPVDYIVPLDEIAPLLVELVSGS
ncbi:MAG: chemotaxis protein CheB [Gammaproteobacteria bacterium]|nr:MAG: chemotaxis protein CheB [Gammaproteobacteria bacterium]